MCKSNLFAYLDDNHQVVVVDSLVEAINAGHEAPKRVCWSEDLEHPGVVISTVFMGVNMQLGDRPEWFETMVFKDGKTLHDYTRRYATYKEAVEGHIDIAAQVFDQGDAA